MNRDVTKLRRELSCEIEKLRKMAHEMEKLSEAHEAMLTVIVWLNNHIPEYSFETEASARKFSEIIGDATEKLFKSGLLDQLPPDNIIRL